MDEPLNDAPAFLEPETHSDDIPDRVDHRTLSRPGSQKGNTYTEEAKALALSIYAETGSFETASRDTHIPRNTIRYWVESNPNIDAELDALRRVIRAETAHRYAQIAIRATDELLDRIENGDEIINKSGDYVRRKVPARELAFIASIATDKHALLTGTMVKQGKEDQTLAALAERLVAAWDAKRRQIAAVDAATYPQASAAGNAT